jgi:hypothetical protein
MSFGKRKPAGFLGAERRSRERRHGPVPAHIVLSSGDLISCCLTNFSERGARVSVTSVMLVPDNFQLLIDGNAYAAEVVRRAVGSVGVRLGRA